MNIAEALRYPFRDPDWPAKMLLGSFFMLLSVFMIGVPVVYGYGVETLQRVRRGEQYPLPEWKDVGVKFITGFKLIVTLLVYSLPLVVIVTPIIIALILTSLANSPMSDPVATGLLTFVFFLVVFPYIVLMSLYSPIVTIRYALHERIREGLELGILSRQLAKVWQDLALVVLFGILLSILATLGAVALFVGIFVTMFYVIVVMFHLCGQVARELDGMERAA